jgi:hypothetical protein
MRDSLDAIGLVCAGLVWVALAAFGLMALLGG